MQYKNSFANFPFFFLFQISIICKQTKQNVWWLELNMTREGGNRFCELVWNPP